MRHFQCCQITIFWASLNDDTYLLGPAFHVLYRILFVWKKSYFIILQAIAMTKQTHSTFKKMRNKEAIFDLHRQYWIMSFLGKKILKITWKFYHWFITFKIHFVGRALNEQPHVLHFDIFYSLIQSREKLSLVYDRYFPFGFPSKCPPLCHLTHTHTHIHTHWRGLLG